MNQSVGLVTGGHSGQRGAMLVRPITATQILTARKPVALQASDNAALGRLLAGECNFGDKISLKQ